MRFGWCGIFTLALLCRGILGQPADPAAQGAENRIKVVVEVVSVDAIVTDNEGRHITDLGIDDFEVYQDGELQEITNFSYVDAVPARTSLLSTLPEDKGRPEVKAAGPVLPVQRKDILRSIAVVVDDMGMSFENLVYVRKALRRFVEDQIHPSDLVAIAMTSLRTGVLSQFTNNEELLNAAVDRIRWGPVHRARPYDRTSFDRQFSDMKRGETIAERNLAIGTLQSLKYTLNSMEELPGRKSVILISEGFRLGYDELEGVGGSTSYMVESLREVMHAAHRSGAVIYAVDPRGGESLGLHPQDDLSGVVRLAQEVYEEMKNLMDNVPDTTTAWLLIEQRLVSSRRLQTMSFEDVKKILDPEAFSKISATRLNQFYQTQQGLNYLPVSTGGLYFKYNNDVNANLGHVLEDQQGYYLIGYAPDPETIRSRGSRRFPRIKVKVKRDNLKVRGRATFMGSLDDKSKSESTPEERMHQYMASPFASGEITLELTSLYEHTPGEGAFVSSWLYVDSTRLAFSEDEDDWKRAELEVWAAAFGERPTPLEEKRETFSVCVRGQSYERLLRDGIVCKVRLPAKKPGPLQLRVVVHDRKSGKIGTANRFLQVPNIEAGQLALSGIVVRSSDSESGLSGSDNMALRKFRRGTLLNYALYIYNARSDDATHPKELEAQVKLFRDGQEVYSGRKRTIDLNERSEESVLLGSGYLQLGSKMETGHYAMQYTVTDKLASDDYGTVSQWIDFQILE